MATSSMCVFCFDTLYAHLERRPLPTPDFEDGTFPLFVTWNKVGRGGRKELRGCIGTFAESPLHSTLPRYAIISATEDRRFNPVSLSEIEYLSCSVSLLTNFEAARLYDWEIGVHGIRISFSFGGKDYSATYLPEVCPEQRWTKDECIESLIRKSGFKGQIGPQLLQTISLERYQSSKISLDYTDYARIKNPLAISSETEKKTRTCY
eukprot:TRINITY_DN1985_c0_g1_i2.p1 TRINITY_DN1985_c0_g1~~TRINITY_DN1985_c0_g1_i2.p1  ORF type:complete len:207 (+),score=32.27 TRINITY_DN1985_c0_g1_i2:78-698(+)